MITFYNDSVSTSDSSVKTMKIDIKIDWASENIEVFANNVFAGTSGFLTPGVTSVDQIKLYNLYQSTSYWKNLVVCSDLCYSFNSGEKLQFLGFLIVLILISIIWSITTIYLNHHHFNFDFIVNIILKLEQLELLHKALVGVSNWSFFLDHLKSLLRLDRFVFDQICSHDTYTPRNSWDAMNQDISFFKVRRYEIRTLAKELFQILALIVINCYSFMDDWNIW